MKNKDIETGAKPEARSLKLEARAEANSAEIAGPAAGGAALQGFMPSCYTGNEETVTGREISLQDGKFSYRDAKKSRRTGDFVTGSTQNEAGPVTAGNWRMLINNFRFADSEGKQDMTAKRSAKYELNSDISMEVLPSWGEMSKGQRGSEDYFPTWRMSMIECRLTNNDLRCTGKNNHQTVKTNNKNTGNKLAARKTVLSNTVHTENGSLSGSNPSRFEKHLKLTPAFATQKISEKQNLRISANSVLSAGHSLPSPSLHGRYPSCPAGSIKVVAGRPILMPGTLKTTAGKGHTAAGRGNHTAGSTHTTAGRGPGAGAEHWNTPLGAGGSAGQRGAGILSSNPSRFEKHLKLTPAFATQPLGVFQTLKVSENNKIREQQIKTASGKLKLSNRLPSTDGEIERGFFFLSPNGGAGGDLVANNLKLSAYET